MRAVASTRLPVLILFALLWPTYLPAETPAGRPEEENDEFLEGRGEFEMVLVHGLGGSKDIWDEMLPYLKGTFKVATFELSGHGETAPIVDPTIEKEAVRLETFIKEQGFAYPTIVGHGMGGMIALQYTLDHPVDVHRLILLDAAPTQLASKDQKQAVAQSLITDYDYFVAARYSAMSPDETVTDMILDSALRTDQRSFISLLMSSFDYDVTQRLRTLPVPLLVVGSELLFPTADTSRGVLRQIGFARARALSFKRMGMTGHYMMLERPVYLASVLMAFGVDAEHIFQVE